MTFSESQLKSIYKNCDRICSVSTGKFEMFKIPVGYTLLFSKICKEIRELKDRRNLGSFFSEMREQENKSILRAFLTSYSGSIDDFVIDGLLEPYNVKTTIFKG